MWMRIKTNVVERKQNTVTMASHQRLSSELLRRGHTTYGSRHERRMRLNRLSYYEQNCRNLRRSLSILLDQYTNLFISGGDTRFIRSQILAHDRILKTDSIVLHHR
jgi:hypothetical protein